MVSGILSIILFAIVVFQSCAVGVVKAINKNKSTPGLAGIIVAILMLAGGISSIALKNSSKKAGSVSLALLFGIAAVVGFISHDSYKDLIVWSGWCLVNTVVSIFDLFLKSKKLKIDSLSNK